MHSPRSSSPVFLRGTLKNIFKFPDCNIAEGKPVRPATAEFITTVEKTMKYKPEITI